MFGLFACSPKKDNSELILEAKSLIQKGDSAAAAINLKNVLQTDPKQSEARYLLGNIYFQQDDLINAEQSLEKAITQGYKLPQARLTLAQIKLSLNKYDEILTVLAEQTFISNFNQTYALRLQGQANLSLNELDIAKEQIKQANNISSESIHAMFGNALLLAYDKDFNSALTSIEHILTKDNHFIEAWLLKGSLHSSMRENKEAAGAYVEYFKLKPKNIGIRTIIAHNYILAGEYDLARPHVDELRLVNDNNPTINVLAAQLEYIDKNYQVAKELANSAALASDNTLAQMISGLSSYNLKEYENAYYQLNAIAELLPKDHQVNKTLAILQLKLGYHDEFATSLNDLDSSESLSTEDAGLFASLGMESVQQGDKENAKKMFERAAALAPDDAQLKAQLGILKLSQNDNDSAVNDLKKALAINPNLSRANIALAMTYLQTNQPGAAKEVAKQWRDKEPDNVLALILSGNVALKSAENEQAITFFEQAIALDKTNLTPLYSLAIIASSQKNHKKSNQYLERLIAIEKEYPRAYQLLVSNTVNIGEEELLEGKFQQYIAESPKSLWPRILLSRRLLDKKETPRAIELLEAITEYEKYPKVYFTQLLEAYIKTNNTEKVADTFILWQNSQQDNATAYTMQINLLEKQKKYKAALTIAKKALQQDKLKNNLQLLTLESYYLLATTQTETASRKIRTLAQKYPDDAFVLRLQGQLAVIHKEFAKAIPFLKQSFELKANTFTGIYLATSYKNNNEEQKAIDFLNKALKETPDNTAYQKYLAQLSIASAPQKAIAQYSSIVEANPKDVVALNNLAWMLLQEGNSSEALIYSRQAVALAPKSPQVLDTLGLVLLGNKQTSEAIKALTTANSTLPNDIEILIHLAQAFKQNNENKKASRLINSLTQEQKNKWHKELAAFSNK